MHRSAAGVAGESRENAQGSQHLKQAVDTKAIEYVFPMLLQRPFTENRQDDLQPGAVSYTHLTLPTIYSV